MNRSDFSLIPFDRETAPQIEIKGFVSRRGNLLTIQYQLLGDLSQILIPSLKELPTRQYNLWEHTCCEFFLRFKNTTQYREFNLAPSRHWNVFQFFDYRQNITEETAIKSLPFEVFQTPELLEINLNLSLKHIIPAEQNLDVAVTTVVENQDRELSYWALTHQKQEADFHDRDSFLISL